MIIKINTWDERVNLWLYFYQRKTIVAIVFWCGDITVKRSTLICLFTIPLHSSVQINYYNNARTVHTPEKNRSTFARNPISLGSAHASWHTIEKQKERYARQTDPELGKRKKNSEGCGRLLVWVFGKVSEYHLIPTTIPIYWNTFCATPSSMPHLACLAASSTILHTSALLSIYKPNNHIQSVWRYNFYLYMLSEKEKYIYLVWIEIFVQLFKFNW